jgi:tetratricopeptide (TPR) repeat protein
VSRHMIPASLSLGLLWFALGMAQQGSSAPRQFSPLSSPANVPARGEGGALPYQQLVANVAAARDAVRRNPRSAESYLALGAALQEAGDTTGASQALDRALTIDQRLAPAWDQKGLLAAEGNKWVEAANDFRHTLEADPNDLLAHLELGEMLLRSGDFETAARELETTLSLDPKVAGARYGLGLIRLQQGDFERAAAEFRRALELRPRYPDALEGLGEVFLRQRAWQDAAAAFQQVLADKPDSLTAVNGLATAWSRLGQKERAQKEFEKAQQMFRQDLNLRRAQGENNRGHELWHEGNLPAAIAAFRSALTIDPSYAEAHNNLGGVLWQQKDQAGAMAEFATAVRSKPDYPEAHNNWGSALMFAGDVDPAVEQFRAALAARPGFASAHFNLGMALEKKQQWAEAEAALRRATVLDPDYAVAHIELGLLLFTRGGDLSPVARTELNKGLQLNPRLKTLVPDNILGELP